MHRSGTSATAHILVELGVSTPDPDDMIEPDPHNERGYWESQTIARFDESVLRHLGGTWAAPPTMAAGWEGADDAAMRGIRARAVELAASVFGAPPAVMKDPRLCLTLPLWRSVLPADPVAVLVFRDPMEVARSLQRRDGFPLTLGLALWHRYVRQSLVSVAGLPVLVVDYAQALDRPRQTVDDLASFLGGHGITPGPDRAPLAARVLTHDLHHERETFPASTLEEDEQPLLAILRDRIGAHQEWSVPELPPEPGWVDDVIRLTWAGQAVTAAMQGAQHELKWLKKSRLFRATHALWRVTRTGPVLSPVEDGAASPEPGSNGAASAPVVAS
jgi:hypothetical protein